jgi:predicted metal-dependent hydrolase
MSAEGDFILELDGEPVPVALLRSRRASRYILRVRAGRQVVLTIPPHGTPTEALRFAEGKRDWIRTALAKMPRNIAFDDGAIIPFKGVPHLVEHREKARGTVWIEPGDPQPLLPEDVHPRLCVAGRYLHLRRRLRDYFEKEAREALRPCVARHARKLGVKVARIQVRDQKSRWGACSASGTLTFSWRLVMAPPFVIDYLAAHEVAHMREMNHSPAFWRLLHELCAETQRAESWLKTNGRELHRYDAA